MTARIVVPVRPGIKPKEVLIAALSGPNLRFINIEVPGGVTVKEVIFGFKKAVARDYVQYKIIAN